MQFPAPDPSDPFEQFLQRCKDRLLAQRLAARDHRLQQLIDERKKNEDERRPLPNDD